MKILLVSTRFPLPSLKGDQVVLLNRVIELSKRHTITLVVLGSINKVRSSDLRVVSGYCDVIFLETTVFQLVKSIISALFSSIPFQNSLFVTENRRRWIADLAVNGGYDVVNFFLLRSWFPIDSDRRSTIVSVVDLIDSMALNSTELIPKLPILKRVAYKADLMKVMRFERLIAENSSAVVVVAARDKLSIDRDNVYVVPNGVDQNKFRPKCVAERGLISFSGNMGYVPNQYAVLWFTGVFHRLKRVFPWVRFRVIGSNMPRGLSRRLRRQGVEVAGYVEDMAEELSKAYVSVVPVFQSSGMQNKVLEAWACGVPVIMTSKVASSFHEGDVESYVVANSDTEFFEEISSLLADGERRALLSSRCLENVEANYSWHRSIRRFESVMTMVTNLV